VDIKGSGRAKEQQGPHTDNIDNKRTKQVKELEGTTYDDPIERVLDENNYDTNYPVDHILAGKFYCCIL
jgi:hypothetical protein